MNTHDPSIGGLCTWMCLDIILTLLKWTSPSVIPGDSRISTASFPRQESFRWYRVIDLMPGMLKPGSVFSPEDVDMKTAFIVVDFVDAASADKRQNTFSSHIPFTLLLLRGPWWQFLSKRSGGKGRIGSEIKKYIMYMRHIVQLVTTSDLMPFVTVPHRC